MKVQALNPDDFEYAGFWIRVLASLIDTAIVCLILVPVFFWGSSVETMGEWWFGEFGKYMI